MLIMGGVGVGVPVRAARTCAGVRRPAAEALYGLEAAGGAAVA